MTEQTPQDIFRFLPGALVEWADRHGSSTSPHLQETHVGALMVTDVSGFTRLTAKLSHNGATAGAERVGHVLNKVVGKLVETIEKQGGSVLSFEGDSLLAGWKAGSDPPALASAVWRGCYCAQALNREFDAIAVEGETLTLRSGIAAGALNIVHLLSQSNSRHIILTGSCVSEVSHCVALADSGEVLVSAEAWQYIDEHAKGHRTDGMVRLLRIEEPPARDPAHPKLFSALASADLVSYLPPVVRARLGSPLSRWLAELRTVTILFIRITEANLLDDISKLEQAVDKLHAKTTKFAGELLRVASCDGGLQALIAFGLPGSTHTDDPRRASLAALELHEAVEQLGLHLSIGIATGDTFCGPLGTSRRAEYTVLGEAVNRAARLSSLAAGRTLTDAVTADAASQFVRFQGPWAMNVPGLRTPIATYIAVEQCHDNGLRTQRSLVGRAKELRQLMSLVQRQPREDMEVVLVEGEAGVGKSALVKSFVELCRAEGVAILNGAADEVERDRPYFAFRRVVRQLLGVEHLQAEQAYNQVAVRLQHRPEHIPFIPLLGDVLDIGIEATSLTEQLPNSVRSENLRRLIRDIVLDGLLAGPAVLLIEDIHWLDAASETLLADLTQAAPPLTAVLTARPALSHESGSKAIVATRELRLASLNEQETAELAQSLLSQGRSPGWLLDAIWNRTGGSPFFISEICQGINQGTASPDEASVFTLPRTARAAILSRTDLLPIDEQFLLKVASAMAATFTVADLESIELLREAKVSVARSVQSFVDAHLLKADPNELGHFLFDHAIIREVVYASMPSEQRQEAHASIARMLEQGLPSSEPDLLSLILRQWQQAGDERKEFEYLDQVAELRLRQYNNSAAISLVNKFLSIAEDHPYPPTPEERVAAAYFIKGEAELNLGQLEAARKAYEDGLRVLKLPLPKTFIGLTTSIIRQAAVHLFRFSRYSASIVSGTDVNRATGPHIDNVVLKAARVHEDLTRIYYFQGDKVRLLHATLRATALAERAGRLSPVLVVNYASLGAICGVIPLRKQADHYLNLANRLSEQMNSPSIGLRVHLLTGLYKTSTGDWEIAKSHFEKGLEQASALGDTRRWCELAVGLETISSPWLLNPSFRGEQEWTDLVDSICRAGLERGDIQVLGCGLTGALRGYQILGAQDAAHKCLDQLSSLLEEHSMELEPIHRLEAAANLADDARSRGDYDAWQHWLSQALHWIDMVNPTMKSRTLPALNSAFRAALSQPSDAALNDAYDLRHKLADTSVTKLRRFARIYPIGRPRAFMVSGDLEAKLGRRSKALRFWRRALEDATRLQLFGEALASQARLRAMSAPLNRSALRASARVDAMLQEHDAPWFKIAERSAASLGFNDMEKRGEYANAQASGSDHCRSL